MVDINVMREMVLRLAEGDDSYTQADFDREMKNLTLDFVNTDEYKLNLSFVNKSNNEDPEYATNGASGFDLRANLNEDIVLEPHGGFSIIPTGLFFEIPENFEIQVRPRSGLAAKNQVTVLNTPGTVDSDYRGEVKVILINHGSSHFTVSHGDRIAQGVVSAVAAKNVIKLTNVKELSSETKRGEGGFGSTGKN